MVRYAVFLFVIDKLQTSTITTYLAGLQHHLVTNDVPQTVWSPALSQVLQGFRRDEAIYLPQNKKIKLPFTRALILVAFHKFIQGLPSELSASSLHAALCLGLMFLLRKSEFLTGRDRKPKMTNGLPATLLAKNLCLWYGETFYSASSGDKIPLKPPDMISIFLPVMKSDQFGKGATRFFPAEPSNHQCMCKVVHAYVIRAGLREEDPVFAGPFITITSETVATLMKATAIAVGVPGDRVSIHSLRIGGLVTLFAAEVPDSLKQFAGRWASPMSFITYARATMQQFSQIASALNNPLLVSVHQIKKFYLSGSR